MLHFDIYLAPFYNQIDLNQPSRNKVKSDAARILRSNSFTKNINEIKLKSSLKQENKIFPNKVAIVPKLFEFSAEYFKPNLANENLAVNRRKFRTSTKMSQTSKLWICF